MEYLRWILLALAVLLLGGVYWFGRRRERNKQDTFYQPTLSDVPSFSAKDRDDVWQDGVGPVRVASRRDGPEIPRLKPELDGHIEPSDTEQVQNNPAEPVSQELQTDQTDEIAHEPESSAPSQPETVVTETPETRTEKIDETEDRDTGDVIVLYLVAQRGERLKGEQLLSAAIAFDLHFGDMNIFHRLDHAQQILFSLSDMMDPGSFVYEKMNEHRTRGVSLFIQLNLCAEPVQALDEMLICAHNLSSLLDLQICDHNRQLLNESIAGSFRARAKHVRDLKRQLGQ